MQCSHCGAENVERAVFCRACGKRIHTPEEPVAETEEVVQQETVEEVETPKKKKRSKKALWIIPIAVILIAVVLVGLFLYNHRDRVYGESLYSYYEAEDGGYALAYDGEVIENTETYPSYSTSLDGKSAAVRLDSDLYFFKGEEKERIAKDVGNYTMAYSGKAVAYQKEGKLYHYNCLTKKSEKIAKDADNIRISHNGKYVAYTTEKGLYIWNGRDSHKLAYGDELNFCVWSVADNGTVYAVNVVDTENNVGTLYGFTKNGKMEKLGENVEPYGYSMLNRGKNQVIFRMDDAFYVSVNGAEAKKLDLSGRSLHIAGSYWTSVKDLREQVYWAYDSETSTVVRLDKNWKAETYFEEAAGMYRCPDNSALYVKDQDNTLYKLNMKTGKETQIAEDVASVDVANFGMVYFTDEDGTLYRNSEKHKVADYVISFEAKDRGGVLYLNEDDDLYSAGIIGKGREIDDDVAIVSHNGRYYEYKKENDDGEEDNPHYDVYYSKNGRSFKKIRGVYTTYTY